MNSSSKPRILTCSVDSFPRMGGVSTLAYEVTQALSGKVSECVYMGPRGTHFGSRPVAFKFYEDWESDQSLRAGQGAPLEDERIFDLMRNIITGYSIDALVAYHPFYYGPAMVEVGSFLGLPTAVMVHGTELTSQFPTSIDPARKDMPDSGADSLSTRLVRTLERAGAVLSNSNFTAQIASRICPDVKPQIVGCGIPVKLLDLLESRSPSYSGDVRARRRARLGLGSATTVTYVGRLVRHKNLFQLIELGAMTGFQIVLIGGGPLRTQLQARAIEAGANVHFEEEASDERKWQVLEASDFGYMMSDYDSVSGGFEGFGIAMLEYSAAGAVCLSSGGHGMADFAHHGFTTFDPRGADGELSGEVLKNLAADEPSMNQLVSASRALLRQEYTWSRVAEKLLEAL